MRAHQLSPGVGVGCEGWAELEGVLVGPLKRIWMVVKGILVKAIPTFLKVVVMIASKDER